MSTSGLDIDRSRASPNHGARAGARRPDSLVLHYTGMRNGPSAVDRLCDPASEVSCHYVVTEAGELLQLVAEDRRAWHAGRSFWQGDTDLNSASIGIEIVNGGHEFGLPPFPDIQIDAVIALCRDLIARYAIRPERILAHSDIAPPRKRDPGERFPWQRLAEAGVGLWPTATVTVQEKADAEAVQAQLIELGYGLSVTGIFDDATATVLRAFQRRYRPEHIDGIADPETAGRLDAVLRLHRPVD